MLRPRDRHVAGGLSECLSRRIVEFGGSYAVAARHQSITVQRSVSPLEKSGGVAYARSRHIAGRGECTRAEKLSALKNVTRSVDSPGQQY